MEAAIIGRIALETSIPESSVAAAAALFEKGATGPFIVHYRKEATGGLDEGKIRSIQERIAYYREVWDQRAALFKLLSEQGKLTDELRHRIENCFAKAELDDLHHQFRPRRRTRAVEAVEKGLEPLAEYFWNQELDAWSVEEHIDVFVDPAKGVSTRELALQGVVDIIAEWIWANIEYRKTLRDMLWSEGHLISSVVPAKVGQKTKYSMYYERKESVTTIPSHRVLAIRRGCKEGILISSIEGDNSKAVEFLLDSAIKEKDSVFAPVLEIAIRECYSRLLRPLIETEVRTQLKERADREAIKVFQENLANLLLSPPAGPIVVMGVDWGKGDECSLAVVKEAGQFVEGAKIRFTPAHKSASTKAPRESGVKPPDTESGKAEQKPEAETTPLAAARLQEELSTETVSSDKVAAEQATEMATEQTPAAGTLEAEGVQSPTPSDNGAVQSIAPAALLDESISDTVATSPDTEAVQSPTSSDNGIVQDIASAAPMDESVSDTVATSPDTEAVQSPTSSDNGIVQNIAFAALLDQSVSGTAATSPDTEAIQSLPLAGSAIIADRPPTEPLISSASNAERPMSEVAESASGSNKEIEEAREILRSMIAKHNVRAISIGTGTGARELETALRQIVQEEGFGDVLIAAVNDAGIAIYSSSRTAREEFPDWNASARCAVSLARRLQDPLAELAKIDPKLIGVGQYQHDVDQKELHRGLLQTVQYCVNKVGVNVNTAGEPLLRYVSGLNDKLARRIVAFRNAQGPFRSRASIMNVVGMDEFTYQQASGFLRIPDGENALDRTAVHPESYSIVEKMASALGVGIDNLIENRELVSSLKLEDFATETVGIPTLNDIREELLRPGRDPRKTFKVPKFRADVKEMSDLKPGMALEGTVTNVTNFGAFVDIGVRQDGLVHLSQMSNRFIRDPREAVKVGDVVQVKVISVEPETKRIGLSMKALLPNSQRRRKKQQRRGPRPPLLTQQSEGKSSGSGATADPASSSPVERASDAGVRPRSNRPYQGSSRNRKRSTRKQENTGGSRQHKEVSPKEPEPTLQEKIAILQSKFRRIN
jgi:uncharacterized protein